MAKYLVSTATLTFGTGTHVIASIPAGKSTACDAVEVTAISDTKKAFIKGCVTEDSEFTVELYQQSGTGIQAGDVGSLTIAATLNNGTSTTAQSSVSYNNVIVTKVDYPSIDATGDRKATYSVTFKPDGLTGSTGNL